MPGSPENKSDVLDVAPKVRVSIATKLSVLLVTLLVGSVFSLAWLSTNLYVDDSRALIQQMTADSADSLAGRFREIVARTHERIAMVGALASGPDGFTGLEAARELLRREDQMLAMQTWRAGAKGGAATPLATFAGGAADADSVAHRDLLETVLRDRPEFSLEKLFEGNPQIFPARLRDDLSAVVVALPVTGENGVVRAAGAAFLSASRFAEAFGAHDLVEAFLVDGRGSVIASSGARFPVGFALVGSALGDALLDGKHHNGQMRFVPSADEEALLAAFGKVGMAGLSVVAAVPEGKAFETARWVQYRAALLALLVLCVAVAMGQWFSGSLTAPIYDLVAGAARIAKGDFHRDEKTKRTKDELGYLSWAFGDMARGLEERDRVKATFHKFHDKEVAERLLAGEVHLGGELRRAAILFSDIRNFTRISEAMEPPRVVEMLNEYMTVMVGAISSCGGVVDKYIGDAIMALWGVPIHHDDDVERAVRACLAMRHALHELNKKRKARGDEVLEMGIGLHFGPVVAGNIGSNQRMEYTVIGDTVNTAARIEAATKELGEPILVSKVIVEKMGDLFEFGAPKEFRPKGKSAAIELYPLLGEARARAPKAA